MLFLLWENTMFENFYAKVTVNINYIPQGCGDLQIHWMTSCTVVCLRCRGNN